MYLCPLKLGQPSYDNQAQFHPRKYLLALSEDLNGEGSYVFEKTRAITVKDGDIKEVVTDQGSIMADKGVRITHSGIGKTINIVFKLNSIWTLSDFFYNSFLCKQI
jgi:hypothetical protein